MYPSAYCATPTHTPHLYLVLVHTHTVLQTSVNPELLVCAVCSPDCGSGGVCLPVCMCRQEEAAKPSDSQTGDEKVFGVVSGCVLLWQR